MGEREGGKEEGEEDMEAGKQVEKGMRKIGERGKKEKAGKENQGCLNR